jgi:Family of unknown function (DUF6338)
MGPFEDLTKLKDLIPILVFLLPGFVSTGIVSLLVVRRPVEPFARVVEAVIFTTINLIVFAVLKRLLALAPFLTIHSRNFFTAGNLALMGFCAVLVGLVWSYEANNQRLFTFLQRLRITIKTTRPSIWIDVFSENDDYVVAHLQDGRRVYGWPSLYSDDPVDRAIYLTEATWLDQDGRSINDPPIGILLDKESRIAFIEFVSEKEPTPANEGEEAPATTDPPKGRSDGTPWFWLFLALIFGYLLAGKRRGIE